MAIKIKRKKEKPSKVAAALIDGVSLKKNRPEVSAKTEDRDDWQQIAMTRDITGARIGNFDIFEQMNKKVLKTGKSYSVPPHVALHLKDIGACVLVGEDSDDEEESEE